jgi:hypothetical protein
MDDTLKSKVLQLLNQHRLMAIATDVLGSLACDGLARTGPCLDHPASAKKRRHYYWVIS